jgi:uncharacterized glyoxalase superfamily protein PhnB
MNNRSVPTSTTLAHLCYRDLANACDWLKRVFGFSEYYRYGDRSLASSSTSVAHTL